MANEITLDKAKQCCGDCVHFDRKNKDASTTWPSFQIRCRCLIHPTQGLTWSDWGSECKAFVQVGDKR